MAERYRHKTVSLLLSPEEYLELRRLCEALQLPVREILKIGMRRAARILREEQRRQHRNGSH
jgi:hypothetical protein